MTSNNWCAIIFILSPGCFWALVHCTDCTSIKNINTQSEKAIGQWTWTKYLHIRYECWHMFIPKPCTPTKRIPKACLTNSMLWEVTMWCSWCWCSHADSQVDKHMQRSQGFDSLLMEPLPDPRNNNYHLTGIIYESVNELKWGNKNVCHKLLQKETSDFHHFYYALFLFPVNQVVVLSVRNTPIFLTSLNAGPRVVMKVNFALPLQLINISLTTLYPVYEHERQGSSSLNMIVRFPFEHWNS